MTQRSTRQVRLLLSYLINIEHLAVQSWPSLHWGWLYILRYCSIYEASLTFPVICRDIFSVFYRNLSPKRLKPWRSSPEGTRPRPTQNCKQTHQTNLFKEPFVLTTNNGDRFKPDYTSVLCLLFQCRIQDLQTEICTVKCCTQYAYQHLQC